MAYNNKGGRSNAMKYFNDKKQERVQAITYLFGGAVDGDPEKKKYVRPSQGGAPVTAKTRKVKSFQKKGSKKTPKF